MKDSYSLKVNDDFDFTIEAQQLDNLDIVNNKNDTFHVLKDNSSYKAHIESSNFDTKEYTITVNSRSYSIIIKDHLDLLIDEMGLNTTNSKLLNDIKAPMPGRIIAIDVEIGQTITNGDPVLVLEAMKMENIILASGDGIVKSILVDTDDTVNKGQLLVEIE